MTAPRILLVNGNSRKDLTARMVALAEAQLGDMAVIEPMTIHAAPALVSNRAEATAAAPEILHAVRARIEDLDEPRPDAVMLACFGEPGLWALRDCILVPVTGMAEASAAAAVQLGRRFSILVSGRAWPDQIADLMALYGLDRRCVRVTAVPDDALSDDTAIWQPVLAEALAREAALGGADVVILGGGLLSGRARDLTPPEGLRLLDAFDTTLMQTLALALATRAPKQGA